jgi:hypothetical protein
VLEGSGKQLRHIKIRSQADLGNPVIRDYLRRGGSRWLRAIQGLKNENIF